METQQAQTELSVIKKIMEDSRKLNIDNGIHYIFWGVLVTFSLLVNYIMLLNGTSGKYIGLMWMVTMSLGAITDVFIGRNQERKSRVKTFAGKMLGSLWFASGISMFMFGFIGTMTKAYNPVFISPIIATSLGISYFTSGAIQQIKWLQNVSLGWWAGAIIMFMFPSVHTLLIFALMMICFQIIPGVILNRKSKEEISTETNNIIAENI